MSDFEKWWDREGNDTTSHEGAKRACEIAWENGTYKINEGLLEAAEWCVALCEEIGATETNAYASAKTAIAKARGEA